MKFFTGILIGMIAIGVVWYWMDSEKVAAPLPPPNWEDVTAEIRAALVANGDSIEERGNLSIFDKKDVTGDGYPEALINTGSGGAYTSYMAVMQMKDGKPVLAKLKDKDGKTFVLSGWPVGASAMHGQDLELIPEKNAISLSSYSVDGRTADIKIDVCRSEVYEWKAGSGLFEWNSSLSEEETADYCAEAASRI